MAYYARESSKQKKKKKNPPPHLLALSFPHPAPPATPSSSVQIHHLGQLSCVISTPQAVPAGRDNNKKREKRVKTATQRHKTIKTAIKCELFMNGLTSEPGRSSKSMLTCTLPCPAPKLAPNHPFTCTPPFMIAPRLRRICRNASL